MKSTSTHIITGLLSILMVYPMFLYNRCPATNKKEKDNTCISICEPGKFIQTYNAHEDHDLFNPPELQLTIEDYNNDSFNDLIFKGARIYYDPQERTGTIKTEPIEYPFLYNPETELFELHKK